MKPSYLKYYDRYSALANLRFLWDAMWTRSKVAKLSLANRQRDYLKLSGDDELLALHRAINEELLKATQEWDSYDYGEGYFYQGFPRIGLSGLRDTRGRVEQMDLRDLLVDKTVLEIGCNTGFVALSVADVARLVVGFDLNPHLIRIAELVAKHLNMTNVELHATGFETFDESRTFDAVLSFANHSTYDENTRFSLTEYFGKCRSLLNPGGLFLFESHPPKHEGEGLAEVCAIIGDLFEVREQSVLKYGTFLDRDRTYIVAEHSKG
jgi:SAM-dependent methyltransferase